jgi:HSP20 family protein
MNMRLLGFSPDLDPFEGLFRLHTRAAFPPVNVWVEPEGWVVRLEVPGVSPDNLTVEVHPRTLEVSGKREERALAEGSFLRRERWSGEFARSIRLPTDLDPSRAEARCEHGVLTLRIPRKEEAKPRQIRIQTGPVPGGTSEPEGGSK